jgi:hypothetical protein
VYHNRVNSDSDEVTYIRNVNNALRKNRRILGQLNPYGKTRASLDMLLSKGFNFNYFTSTQRTREGLVYYYCYDQGYRKIDQEIFLLVKKKNS